MQTPSRTPIFAITNAHHTHTHTRELGVGDGDETKNWKSQQIAGNDDDDLSLGARSGLSLGRRRLDLCGEAGGGALAGAVEAEHGQPLGEGVAEPAGRPAPAGPAHAHPPAGAGGAQLARRRAVHGGGVLGRDDGGVGVGAAGAGAGEERRRERERLDAAAALGAGAAVPGGRLGDARAVLPREGHGGGAQRGREEPVERRRRPRREQGERGRRRRRLHQGRRRRVVVVVGVIGLPLEEAPAPARRGYGGGRRGRSRRGARRRGGHRGRPLVAPGLDLVVVPWWW